MASQIKEYLRETTVHGFRYVVECASAVERLSWVLLIAAAFSCASVLVYRSLDESSRNPVATSVESVPANTLAFPAVTLGISRGRSKDVYPERDGLLELLLNSLTFDCLFSDEDSCSAKSNGEAKLSRNQSLKLSRN